MNEEKTYHGPNAADYLSAFAGAVTPVMFGRIAEATATAAIDGDPHARDWIAHIIFESPLPMYHGSPASADTVLALMEYLGPSELNRFVRMIEAARQERGRHNQTAMNTSEVRTDEVRSGVEPNGNHPEASCEPTAVLCSALSLRQPTAHRSALDLRNAQLEDALPDQASVEIDLTRAPTE